MVRKHRTRKQLNPTNALIFLYYHYDRLIFSVMSLQMS